jgi:hypothetical protein
MVSPVMRYACPDVRLVLVISRSAPLPVAPTEPMNCWHKGAVLVMPAPKENVLYSAGPIAQNQVAVPDAVATLLDVDITNLLSAVDTELKSVLELK